MKKVLTTAKSRVKEGRGKEAEDLLKTFDVFRMDKIYKGLSNAQSSVNNIWLNPDITSEEKKSMIDQMYLDMIEISKEANKEMEKAVKQNRSKK